MRRGTSGLGVAGRMLTRAETCRPATYCAASCCAALLVHGSAPAAIGQSVPRHSCQDTHANTHTCQHAHANTLMLDSGRQKRR
eukprot:352561-Chlamydomonas_euryale.AAC.4